MNNSPSSSTSTDIYARFGSNSYIVYESKFLDLDVKFADVNGTNLFHVKSFVESYNKVNDKPIIEFFRFLEYDKTPDYLQTVYEIDHLVFNEVKSKAGKKNKKNNDTLVGSDPTDLFDSNNRWNIPNVIVYCYSQLDNTKGYWVSGEVLSRYAQYGNIKFAVMVDHLIAAIATFNEQKMNEALKCLTLDKEKMQNRIEYFKTECNHMTNYMKPEIGKDYVAYVEWIANKNELYIGSMEKKKFLNIRAKKDEQGNPLRYFIYAKDNKFGIQLRDLYRDCLIDLFGDMVRVNKCHLTFIPKVNLNNIQWRVRNCMQRIRVTATVPEV